MERERLRMEVEEEKRHLGFVREELTGKLEQVNAAHQRIVDLNSQK